MNIETINEPPKPLGAASNRSRSNQSSNLFKLSSGSRSSKYSSTQSRYKLPSLSGQPSRMNASLKNILVAMDQKGPSNTQSIQEAGEINNDIFNEAIINQYTESAFKISDLRHKLEIYKSNRQLQKEKEIQEL
jgi:hypothetical protein